MSDKVCLCIFQHKKTGKKYFSKTTRYFTESDLLKYGGSGVYWRKHLKKHGKELTVQIHGIYSLDETSTDYVKPIALKFSEDNDIVNSKEWANLIPENGLNGNGPPSYYKCSEETRKKLSLANLGRIISEETKLKISQSKTGKIVSEETKNNIKHSLKENDSDTGLTKTELAQSNRIVTIYADGFDRSYEYGHKSNDTKKTTILENGLSVIEQQSLNMSNYIKQNRTLFDERCKRASQTNSNKHHVYIYDTNSNLIEKIRYKEFRKKYPISLLNYNEPNLSYRLGPCKYPEYRGWYAIKIKSV